MFKAKDYNIFDENPSRYSTVVIICIIQRFQNLIGCEYNDQWDSFKFLDSEF